jgi:hypothetical protein
VDVVDEEGQRMQRAADEGCRAGDEAAAERAAAAGERAVVGEALRHAHADGGTERGGDADQERGVRADQVGRGEDGCERRDGAVDEADQAGLNNAQQPLAVVGGLPGVDEAARAERSRGHGHSLAKRLE